MIGFAPRDQVGHQIQYVFLVHGIEQSGGHHGYGGGFDRSQVFGFHLGHGARLHHIGVHPILVVSHVHDSSVELGTIGQAEYARTVLIAYFLARIDDRFQQIVGSELSAHGGKVGANRPSFSADAVAGITASRAKHLAAILEIPFAGNSAGHPRGHILHGPILNEGAWLEGELRCAGLRFCLDDLFETYRHKRLGDAGNRILFDAVQVVAQTGSSLEVACPGKPFEIRLAKEEVHPDFKWRRLRA